MGIVTLGLFGKARTCIYTSIFFFKVRKTDFEDSDTYTNELLSCTGPVSNR